MERVGDLGVPLVVGVLVPVIFITRVSGQGAVGGGGEG